MKRMLAFLVAAAMVCILSPPALATTYYFEGDKTGTVYKDAYDVVMVQWTDGSTEPLPLYGVVYNYVDANGNYILSQEDTDVISQIVTNRLKAEHPDLFTDDQLNQLSFIMSKAAERVVENNGQSAQATTVKKDTSFSESEDKDEDDAITNGPGSEYGWTWVKGKNSFKDTKSSPKSVTVNRIGNFDFYSTDTGGMGMGQWIGNTYFFNGQ